MALDVARRARKNKDQRLVAVEKAKARALRKTTPKNSRVHPQKLGVKAANAHPQKLGVLLRILGTFVERSLNDRWQAVGIAVGQW